MTNETVSAEPLYIQNELAKRKANQPGWEPYMYALAKDGMHVTGAVLKTVTRGPRKGSKTSRGCISTKIFISAAEVKNFTNEKG